MNLIWQQLTLAVLFQRVSMIRSGRSDKGICTTNFYGVPHPDDWQLFMTPNSIGDVLDSSTNTVFVGFTAGDAGNGWTGAPAPIGGVPYAQTREEGNKRSLRFISALLAQKPS